MAGAGLGFEELAKTIQDIGNSQVSNTYTGLNAMSNIDTNALTQKKTGLDIEAANLKLNEDKQKIAHLDSPLSTRTLVDTFTANLPTAKRVQALNKVPEAINLLGWKIDENDPDAPILKKDGKPVTNRELGYAGNVIVSYFASSTDPFVRTQKSAAEAKSAVQALVPNINLGPGVETDVKLLTAVVKAGKSNPEILKALNQYGMAKQEYDYISKHPREAYEGQITNLTKIKAILKDAGGEGVAMADEQIKRWTVEADKHPVTKTISKATGLEEGTLLSEKSTVDVAGHTAQQQSAFGVANIHAASQARSDATKANADKTIQFVNNYINAKNNAMQQASKDVAEIAKSRPVGQELTQEQITKLTNDYVLKYSNSVDQNAFDILGPKGFAKYGLNVPESVDQSTPQFRQRQHPVIASIGSYLDTLKKDDPAAIQIANQLSQVEKTRHMGDEATADNLLTQLSTSVEQLKKVKKENKNKAIQNGAKGLSNSWFHVSPEYGPSAIN